MKTSGNIILVTGGATGIGFALVEAFIRAGNKVLICGRRKERLEEARTKLPGLEIKQCNLSKREERESFCDWVKDNYKDLNIVVNNAGVQKSVDLKKGTVDLFAGDDEVQTNFIAPIHLSAYFAPLLMRKSEAAIVNVSSGLGFVPIAFMPVYCATKAGVHSFTVSLRQQLKDTTVKVFEIVPPAVDTELGKGSSEGPDQDHYGIPPTDIALATMKALQNDEYEIIVGEAKNLVEGSRKDFAKVFQQLNSW
jgi:uncharacterized oxidoreductase